MHRWTRTLGAGLVVLLLTAAANAEPRRVALLVGIGEYEFDRIPRLEGPRSDVAAMRDVLIRRWQFAPEDIHTLIDRQATRDAILAELRDLQRRTKRGDEVLIFYSGHGTSALDAGLRLPLPYGSGAWLASDFRPSSPPVGLIAGRTDLRPQIEALELGGRRLWVVADSCYSGNQVRSVRLPDAAQLPAKTFIVPSETLREDLAQASPPAPEPYPYRETVYLSAAAEGEVARDIPSRRLQAFPTIDGKPHGTLTDALLRVLEGQLPADADGDGYVSLNEMHRAVTDFMASRAYGHTSQRLPSVAEDTRALGSRPLLSLRGVAAPAREVQPTPLLVRATGLPSDMARTISGLPDVRLNVGGSADIDVRASDGSIRVLSAAGDLIGSARDSEGARIVGQIRQLAWAKRVDYLATKHRRAILPMEVSPSAFGGNFKVGQKLSFVVRPDREATVVLMNIDSSGQVSILYPKYKDELRPLAAGAARHIPGEFEPNLITVQLPEGQDVQFGFAFDEPPAGIERLIGVVGADPGDPRLAGIEQMLSAMNHRYTAGHTELRTIALPK